MMIDLSTAPARAKRSFAQLSPTRRFPTVVAIPALNEEARLEACIEALLRQTDRQGRPLDGGAVQIAILANNCSDGTADLGRRLGAAVANRDDLPKIHVREVTFAPEDSHAGQARRTALDWGIDLLADAPEGLICTTDADSRVFPDWLAQTWAERTQGAEVVAGTVEFDTAEASSLVLPEARLLEARYSALQAELDAAIDPVPHDPWPNHIWAWGASLAVTRDIYLAAGGLPRERLAEDRAFVALLQRMNCKVRHSLKVRVRTSCRTHGRAPGGLADLIATYRAGTDYPCDAELQPVEVIESRARCRRSLRSIFGGAPTPGAATELGLSMDQLAEVLAAPHFGEAWAIIERDSTRYYTRRVWPAELPGQIRQATALLTRIKAGQSRDRRGKAHAATAGLWTRLVAQQS